MRVKAFLRWAWLSVMLVAFSLGCKLAESISQVVAVATQIDLEARATDFEMGALPTGFDLNILATEVEKFATEMDPGALETQMGALSTEIDLSQILTQMPPLQGTIVAIATPSGFPADIPLLEGERLILNGTANSLQYAARVEFSTSVEFYRREMASRGWIETSPGRILDRTTVLFFQSGDRTAVVTIAEDYFLGVIVSITLER